MIPLLCLSLCTLAQTSWSARGFAPTFLYEKTTIEGFEVFIAPEIRTDQDRKQACLKTLQTALRATLNLLPPDRLKPVLGSKIWLEWDIRNRGLVATYLSQDAKSLRELGVNPDKSHTLEISNSRTFVLSQNAANRHILAAISIAILDKDLKPGRAAIEATYRRAMEDRLWECASWVAPSNDTKPLESRLYPTAGVEQYFAVLTLAHFDLNDFYPFNRDDLRNFDPRGAALMSQVWDSR